jgi:ABC-2 type transport system permease protein
MFRTIFTKSLRDYRWAILGWGIGLGLLIYIQYATFASTFTSTSTAQIQQLVQQFRFFGESTRVGTPGGFVTFKIMGVLPLVLSIWTILAGARMIRGEEERGTLDILLSTPHSRTNVAAQKVLAMAAAVGFISLLMAILILAGMAAAGVSVDPPGAVLAAANAGLAALLFGALAVLLAQFTSRGAAAGWAAALMAVFFVLDGTGRAVDGASWLRLFSPFSYYDRNIPLVPGHSVNWGALAVLVILSVLVAGAAVPLFLRRDLGRTMLADVSVRESKPVPPEVALARATRSPWTQSVGLQALRRRGATMFWWIVALALFSGYLVTVAKTSERQLQHLLGGSALVKQVFGGTNLATNNGFLSALVFGYAQLLLTVFALIIAQHWASDLDAGRLEMILSTSQPRRRVLLERYAAVFVAALITTVCVWLSIVLVAAGASFSVDAGRVAVACLGMLPLELITASLVFALAGLMSPGLVMGIVAVFLVASYVVDILKSLLKLPNWVVNLSIFHQYGSPILHGMNWTAFLVMLLVAALLLGVGAWQFSARDVYQGAA